MQLLQLTIGSSSIHELSHHDLDRALNQTPRTYVAASFL